MVRATSRAQRISALCIVLANKAVRRNGWSTFHQDPRDGLSVTWALFRGAALRFAIIDAEAIRQYVATGRS